MSWIRESNLNWFQRLCVNVIKAGPVPKHIAFIMDGNRRFATKSNIEKSQGHARGFDKLSDALQWCLDIGVKEVTVYAFSIENFKRSKEEVNTLLSIAREKFSNLLEQRGEFHKKGFCLKVIGKLTMLPEDLQQTIAEVMLLTKDNDKAILNVGFAYTSREEITTSMKTIAHGVQDGLLEPNDVDDDLISKCLYTDYNSEPDLLVRTSGESRFSDFLLWQTSTTAIFFTKTLWPEFTLWHLLYAVFSYQRSITQLENAKNFLKNSKQQNDNIKENRINKFLYKVNNDKIDNLITVSGRNK